MRMLLTIAQTTDEAIALKRFRNCRDLPSLEAAATLALRKHLASTGDLKALPPLEEDSEVIGTA